ncbi:MAG: ParB/RepB/Spo0J family partition protein [Candidatus Omnitrophica bacterium]|nr:ParB/RepB/Spo0J family partition protein [Candidatus Omnitrophota bacterium]
MKKALGKGLNSLIPDSYVKASQARAEAASGEKRSEGAGGAFEMVPITKIRPNRDQPRKVFDPEAIEDLAASIKEKGVLQPVVVKKMGPEQYELICGERRLRAATLCGLEKIPAVVKDLAPADFLEWALIENIQRQDLNPIEEAEAYSKLAEDQMISQEEIAKRVGKKRVTVTNSIRLLRLPQDIRHWIAEGMLTAGHARALLTLLTPEHQRQIAKRIVEDHLSVRQVEALVGRSTAHKRSAKRARSLTPEIADLEHRVARQLGAMVKLHANKNMKQGRIEIHYFSLDELDAILERLGVPKS